MDLVIDREKWVRGGRGGESALLNSVGNMCCLGFAAIAVGLDEGEITGIGEFSDLDPESVPHLEGLTFNPFCTVALEDEYDHHLAIRNTEFHDQAVDLNDFRCAVIDGHARSLSTMSDISISSEDDRERQLTKLFAKAGITLTFEGAKIDEQEDSQTGG